MKYFSLNKSQLANKLYFAFNLSPDSDNLLTIDRFSDGELCPIFRESIRDHHLFIMADGHSAEDIMKLLLTVDAAKRSGAKRISVIYPYAPYSRQDKNDHVRSSIGAKLLADMLQTAGVTRIITIEMHAPAIQGFYNIPVVHINGNRIFTEYAKSLNLEDVTICPPDHGALKRNTDFAKLFPDSLFSIIDKKRVKPNEIASMEITGVENISGRNIVSIDDMGDTLGTLSKAAALVMSKGAKSFRAFLTHPVLSGTALETLYNSEITELVVSDTIVSVYEKEKIYNDMLLVEANKICEESFKVEFETILEGVKATRPKFTIISCDALLIKSINRLINKQSINELNIA